MKTGQKAWMAAVVSTAALALGGCMTDVTETTDPDVETEALDPGADVHPNPNDVVIPHVAWRAYEGPRRSAPAPDEALDEIEPGDELEPVEEIDGAVYEDETDGEAMGAIIDAE